MAKPDASPAGPARPGVVQPDAVPSRAGAVPGGPGSVTPAPETGLGQRLARPTLGELWTFLAVALPAVGALVAPMSTVDLAYQLRAGAAILAGQGIPTTDTWTFTVPGAPWHDQQWLAQAFLAAVFEAGGWGALAILRAVLVAAAFGLLLAAVRTRAPGLGSRTHALLVIGAFIVAAPALALRPQLIAIVLFAATLLVLAGRRTHPRWLWLIPVITALWANVHGSFALAILLAGFAWLEDIQAAAQPLPPTRSRHLVLVVAAAATVATLLNPTGFDVWSYAIGLATNPTLAARVSEWRPPTPATPSGLLFYLSLVSVVALLGMSYARLGVGRPRADGPPAGPLATPLARPPWPATLALLLFAILGIAAGRGVAWWPFVAAVTVAGLLGAPSPAEAAGPPAPAHERRSRLNAVIAVAIGLAGLAALPSWRPAGAAGVPKGLLTEAPQGIAAELASGRVSGTNVWNPQLWGSWLELAVATKKVATDSRIELFPPGIWDEADQVVAASGAWRDVLDRRGVDVVVTAGKPDSALDRALVGTPGWTPEYRDADGSIWVRAPTP